MKRKILFYNNHFFDGGVEVFLKCVAEYLADTGYDVTVVATPRTKAERNHPYGPKVKCVWRPFLKSGVKKYTPFWFWDHFRYRILEGAVEAYLSLRGFDIVVAVKEKFVMRDALRIRGKQRFAWVHMDYSTRAEMHTACFARPEEELACMRRYDKVVCVSEITRNGILQKVGDPGNLIVKYVPMDYERIIRLSGEHCTEKHAGDRPLIVSIGRLIAEKQFDMLIRACADLHKEIPFDLWIIGDGKERRNLEDLIDGEKLDFVRLLGSQSNPYPYLAQADLFVSSSRTESYGMAVQEALILGVPVVAVRCPGIEEALDPRFGILTENSTGDLADAIGTLLGKPDELKRYRDVIAGQYDRTDLYEKRMKAITDLWEDPAAQPCE